MVSLLNSLLASSVAAILPNPGLRLAVLQSRQLGERAPDDRGTIRPARRASRPASGRSRTFWWTSPPAGDLFLDLARLCPEHAERTTLYASEGERLLRKAPDARRGRGPRAA